MSAAPPRVSTGAGVGGGVCVKGTGPRPWGAGGGGGGGFGGAGRGGFWFPACAACKAPVADWRELVESVMVDWNYDGAVLTPALVDIPERDEMVRGVYAVPDEAGAIRVKITATRTLANTSKNP